MEGSPEGYGVSFTGGRNEGLSARSGGVRQNKIVFMDQAVEGNVPSLQHDIELQ